MFEKIEIFSKRYDELNNRLYDPTVASDATKFNEIMKEVKSIEPIVLKYREYKKAQQAIKDSLEILETEKDKEIRELAQMEMDEAKDSLDGIEEELKILLLPKDPNDERNVIMEIRGGTGGEESSLFAGDLFRMYSMYADKHGFKIEILSSNETGLGGYKEISFMVNGEGAYSKLKYESGTHRVQRVPETESAGRVHTSTATVLVMPEAEEIDVEIKDSDIRIDITRSSGAGGQCVNTTDSAVRVTHIPTGIIVYCQVERSQIKNKERALQILKTRLFDLKQREQDEKLGNERRSKIGTGDRAEKIRTYNYPQNRLTDHRINYTVMHLDKIMEGDLEDLIEALIAEDERMRLEEHND